MKTRKRYLMVILWGTLSAAFFFGGVANAVPISPVGQAWDLTVSGVKLGSAYLTFSQPDVTVNGGTVSGYIIVAPGSGSGKGTRTHPVSFGYAPLDGWWMMDGNKVTGFLYNLPGDDTLRLDITSFTGTVTNNGGNLSFAIAGVTVDGNVSLNGIPSTQYTVLPGTWTIEKYTQGKLTFYEIFTATPDQNDGGGNLYDLLGVGADTCIVGHGALSKGSSKTANNFNVVIKEYPMPQQDPGDCSTLDPSTATGTLSAGTGTILFQSDADRASLNGYQAGSPSPKVVMPVICNN